MYNMCEYIIYLVPKSSKEIFKKKNWFNYLTIRDIIDKKTTCNGNFLFLRTIFVFNYYFLTTIIQEQINFKFTTKQTFNAIPNNKI